MLTTQTECAFEEESDLEPMLDVIFSLLFTFLFLFTFYSLKQSSFALPHGPIPDQVMKLSQVDLQQTMIVAMDENQQITLNGRVMTQENLISSMREQRQGIDKVPQQVIYQTAPTLTIQQADHLQLKLLEEGFIVLKQYQQQEKK